MRTSSRGEVDRPMSLDLGIDIISDGILKITSADLAGVSTVATADRGLIVP
jgi:hypothetical protein